MEMEAISSDLISHRGYDPETQTLHIRFASKTFACGSLYEYGNVSPAVYKQACEHISTTTGEVSFGQYFQRYIKPDAKTYPYRQLETAHGEVEKATRKTMTTGEFAKGLLDASLGDTTDFASGQPIPATTPAPLPEDEAALIEAALELHRA